MNDIELINQVKKGNPNAYRFLVSKYQRLVFSIAYKMANQNQADIEDIAQDVFVKVYKNIKSYRKESKLSTWIASIAWKTSIDFTRKKKRSRVEFTEEPELFDEIDYVNSFEQLKQKELKQLVQEVVSSLPVHYQTVLSLFYLEEFSLAEIHEITEMPLGTIKSYLSRARALFKTELERVHGSDAINLLYKET
ncbi:RNA polymerase sigma factor [Saccharicrinis sp. 156]|uniref:RNA polymerase sigma factor n=1 Tax=Saccharicrinis sp. 156 TaxID=3417574 RepID=UPI003D33CFCF